MTDKNFPMLAARSADYPYTRNVDVDSTTPTYDYSRWTAGARLRLYHVQWTRDNVVDFGSEAKRDAWFDAHAAATVTLETSANVSVDGTIKLPIPFTTLRRYNYVTVDYPDFPVDRTDNPIRLYAYRIIDVRSAAPSTSVAVVELDEWQTYRYRLTFSRCALDRGHYAVNKTPDVETYLADPIDFSDWVRIPETDAPASGPRQITAWNTFDVWGGEKYVVLGSTAPAAAWRAEIPTPGKVDAGAAPTYADTEDRYGYQYNVTAGFNPAGEDWSAAPGADSITTASPDGRAPALTAIAIKASDVYGANRVLDKLQTAAPWLYESVRAAIIVPASFILIGEGFDFLGTKAYECRPAQNSLGVLKFQAADFHFPADCLAWTKLYAWPYSVAEVSDDLGHKVEIRIEDCAGAATIHTRCVALFPFVKASAFISNYETRGVPHTYNWEFTRLDGSKGMSTFYGTNPAEHSFEMDIPTFALWRNSSATLAYDQGAQWERTGRHAVTDYHNAMRSANTGLENTKASAATTRSNAHVSNALALSNATRSADTGLTNAKASSATTRSNAHVSNALALSNATRSADTGLTNAKASSATTRSNAHVSNALALSNATRSADTGLTNAKASADTARTNTTTQTAAQTQATARTNTNAIDNTTLSNELATYTTTRNSVANILITGLPDEQSGGATPVGSNYWKLSQDFVADNNLMTAQWTAANSANIESIAPMAVTNAAQGVTGAASSLSGVTGSMGAHMATSALAGTAAIAAGGAAALAVGATAIHTIGASLQYGINLTKEQAIIDANRTMMQAKKDNVVANLRYVNVQQRDLATDITKASTDKAAQIVQNSANTARDTTSYAVKAANDVADADKTTAYANAQRSRDTAVSNATDSANTGNNIADTIETTTNTNAKLSRDTTVDNATDSANTGNNIADATEATTNATAGYSRTDVSEYAAKKALENARLDMMADYKTAGRTQPTAQGADSGNVDMLEWGGAVHVRVRTQPVAELERAASNFALTGYAAGGRLIDTKNTLQVRKHYSYWRGTMWVNPAPGVPWSAIDDIRDAFVDGLTVWSKPEEIGAVDPFEN